ncbi:hypothetical protein H2200_002973 [Cladophialophora chaetospira]|uniref:Sister chromatid cohesion protein Dcc1 n=1 Tax=Cladophialophora chaetospira TaxID=386627 RepID=A0AA38XGM0_9EURO|nr:hypothetical protein H2200_002973 [Cladophialophora chaetospira]
MASSQSSTFPPIPFCATTPQESFRLLELTPDLVEVIESQRQVSSKRRKLWFKSSAPSSSTGRARSGAFQAIGGDVEKEGYLHLCTDEKIWAVKQVSTSNSVHVVRTMSAEEARRQETERRDRDEDGDLAMDEGDRHVNGDDVSGDPGKGFENGGVTAISQVKNILELIEVKPDEIEVERILRDEVPIFPDADTEDEVVPVSNHISKEDLFDNIPFPTNMITSTMKRLFVFGHKSSSTQAESIFPVPRMFIPSTTLLLKAWMQFTTQCTISGLKLDRNGGVDYHSLHQVLLEVAQSCISPSEAEVTLNVIMAILRRVAIRDDCADLEDPVFYVQADLDCRPFTDARLGTDDRTSLDPSATRDLVGRWLPTDLKPGSTPVSGLKLDTSGVLTVEAFLDGWTKLIPDSWAKECDVHAIVASVEGWEIGRNSQGKEVLKMSSDQGVGISSANHPEQAKAQPRKKGKWHEKFGAQRSAAVKK